MTSPHLSWDGPLAARRVFQDVGPWTWYLPEAWQQAAAPELSHHQHRRPLPEPESPSELLAAHGPWIAYWAPLLHLTTFGLGWTTPDIGLWKWGELGRPTEDSVLATIAQRYGNDVELMTAWLCEVGPHLRHSAFEDQTWRSVKIPAKLASRNLEVKRLPFYQAVFTGGGDPQHLVAHIREYEAGHEKPTALPVSISLGGEAVDYLLIGEEYRTLLSALHSGIVPAATHGRSARVALMCPSVGWLGTYRKSRTTGLWFRGRHRWHLLGNAPLGATVRATQGDRD